MIGVFLNGERVTGYGYEYAFDTVEQARETMDKYGYRGYEYREIGENELSLDKATTIMLKIIEANRKI